MDGSPRTFILMLIVITPLLAGWLAMVFYAGSHPGHKTRNVASEVAGGNSLAIPRPRSAPAEPAHRKEAFPVLPPVLAYSSQTPDPTADAGRAASLHGGAERPAA